MEEIVGNNNLEAKKQYVLHFEQIIKDNNANRAYPPFNEGSPVVLLISYLSLSEF